ncbi:S26 family signal peptidase [Kordiimonas aquimaris]|uniref:S26 family signal peptidase n=1 Tax=Kordiimonas aquimaris TaxID=707591 RepID=UPI0021CFD0E8|nr:S26 family signal peptidase [Kordiimonas aquimaris]
MISFIWFNSIKLARDWRRSLLVLALALLWFDVVGEVAGRYAFNMTASVDGKIFKMRPDLAVEKQATVMFKRDDPLLPAGVNHMTKHVLCFSGDILKRDGLDFYCNGEKITRAKRATKTGDPLRVFDWSEGQVPEGVFFAGTRHPDGYDSRYYGFVPLGSAVIVEKVL